MPAVLQTWSTPTSRPLLFREWPQEGLAAVYNPTGGDTHLVEEFALNVLKLLTGASLDASQLAHRLAEFFEGHDEAQNTAFVESTLLQLQGIGLVRSTP